MSTYSVGVDLGGTSLRAAAFTADWRRLESVTLPTRVSAGPDAVVGDIRDAIHTVMGAAGGRKLEGVGVGSPGPMELPAGRLGRLPNFPGWDGFELKRALEGALEMPVIVESDANAAALAEWIEGAGKRFAVDSLCMLTLGTGVGNGIILDGKIWHGMTGMGGEAGHIPLFPDGPACGCGGQGCLEMYASATAFRRLAREHATQHPSGSIARMMAAHPQWDAGELASLADSGDAEAHSLFDDLGRYVGIGLAGVVNTLNLPLYIVGGGLASAWRLFANSMFAALRHYSYVYRLTEPISGGVGGRGTEVVPALLGPAAGLLGAAMLPRQQAQPTRAPDQHE